ncbi:TetR/AcrR family transcriptional regulator [Streptomyces montanisoli]|uniref:TetR/AcrR family transcriptional regulator n=1 Tax=Streptomyces montanisoli TaxID=2798581 RepID=A0A940RVH7_9ACTN|nr:TetR/AcrR family transcriptional regulator [Streptomyces montanisoli]MBP0459067.1 TetR/AcrR family transcriptional regulator [Streptomyces montanisoli]
MPETAEQRPYHHGSLRAALLDAAERGLRERGADRLSLRDLAREIGVSHAAPRRHFADRQALLDALAEAGFVRLGAAMHAALSEGDGDGGDDGGGGEREFPTRVRDAVSAFAHFATENPALHALMNAGKHRPGATRVAQAAASAFAQMYDLIEEGQANDTLRQGDPEEIGIILYATVQGITTMVNNGMIDAARLDGLIDTAVALFLRGARPPGR